jgi:hypothetical protein
MQRVEFVPTDPIREDGATEVVVTLKDGRTVSAAVPELGFNVVPDAASPSSGTYFGTSSSLMFRRSSAANVCSS